MRICIAVLLAIFLQACASSSIRQYEPIDSTEKTVSMALGPESTRAEIKDLLIRNGYRVVVASGGVKTIDEKNGTKLSLSEHSTRYDIRMNSQIIDIFCWGGEELQYSISVIDNKTGSEILTQYGSDCGSHIVGKFADAMHLKR